MEVNSKGIVAQKHQIFLTVILVLKNQARHLEQSLAALTGQLTNIVQDFEIIIVDNASSDDSLQVLKELTKANGLPNLQVFALTDEVELDTGYWVGLENSLGDFVLTTSLNQDEYQFIPTMLENALNGADVVFATNTAQVRTPSLYSILRSVFNKVHKTLHGIHLSDEAPRYRLLSRHVINFILQHSQPFIAYRQLPAKAGFTKAHLHYRSERLDGHTESLIAAFDRAVRILVSTSRAPMRFVSALSLFGAIANLAYSVYVLLVGFFKNDVAPGWLSLSLQQSGMFFLFSLVLLVLGEYILQMAKLSNEGPLYFVGQELTSVSSNRVQRLNIETNRHHSAP